MLFLTNNHNWIILSLWCYISQIMEDNPGGMFQNIPSINHVVLLMSVKRITLLILSLNIDWLGLSPFLAADVVSNVTPVIMNHLVLISLNVCIN